MKTKTTQNLTSAVMFIVLTPFLTLAMFVSVKSSGVVENDVLLVLLTLSGAVLSGINGFGRRTTKSLPPSSSDERTSGCETHDFALVHPPKH